MPSIFARVRAAYEGECQRQQRLLDKELRESEMLKAALADLERNEKLESIE